MCAIRFLAEMIGLYHRIQHDGLQILLLPDVAAAVRYGVSFFPAFV